jgi:hypothetical protein
LEPRSTFPSFKDKYNSSYSDSAFPWTLEANQSESETPVGPDIATPKGQRHTHQTTATPGGLSIFLIAKKCNAKRREEEMTRVRGAGILALEARNSALSVSTSAVGKVELPLDD